MGSVEFTWNGQEVERKIREAAQEALWLTGQAILSDAHQNIPLDHGILRASGRVTMGNLPNPSIEYEKAKSGKGSDSMGSAILPSTAITAFVSYNTPYAARLHENMNWKPRSRKKMPSGNWVDKPAVGGPKWLEKSLPKARGWLVRYLREQIAKRGG